MVSLGSRRLAIESVCQFRRHLASRDGDGGRRPAHLGCDRRASTLGGDLDVDREVGGRGIHLDRCRLAMADRGLKKN